MKPGEAIKRIRSAGFDFIKVELEAEVDFDSDYASVSETCDSCGGSGTHECGYCDGDGTIPSETDGETQECFHCDGSGTRSCYDCDGNGVINGETSTNARVHELGKRVKALFLAHLEALFPGKNDHLTYYKAYVDGSVNTEITLTLPTKYATALPKLMEIFSDVCNEAGGYETENAGMHITILERGNYENLDKLPTEKIKNFTVAMDTFVPYLYALATDGGTWTRSLYYRQARCSDYEKYSAIYTHGNRCIEYRLFDTCYSNPERIMTFLGVIARTLSFYRDTLPTSVQTAIATTPEVSISDDEDFSLASAYSYVSGQTLAKGLKNLLPRSVYKVCHKNLKVATTYRQKTEALKLITTSI